MTVKEMLERVVRAEEIREDSYDHSKGEYRLSKDEAVRQAMVGATEAEITVANFLIEYAWNDVQDWVTI